MTASNLSAPKGFTITVNDNVFYIPEWLEEHAKEVADHNKIARYILKDIEEGVIVVDRPLVRDDA